MITKEHITFNYNLRYFYGSECVALEDDLGLNSDHPPQLSKVKRLNKGKNCAARSYEKFVNKVGHQLFKECKNKTCLHKNFIRYQTCLKCKEILPEHKEKESSDHIIIYDIERAKGPYRSEIVQVAALKVKLSNFEVLEELCVNALPSGFLSRRLGILMKHHFYKKDDKLFFAMDSEKKSLDVEVVACSQREAYHKFFQFICESRAIIAHGEDILTIDHYIQNKHPCDISVRGVHEVRVERNAKIEVHNKEIHVINSQDFFQVYCQNKFNFGMKTLVKELGDSKTKTLYSRAHDALVDSQCLLFLCFKSEASYRFIDWFRFELSL